MINKYVIYKNYFKHSKWFQVIVEDKGEKRLQFANLLNRLRDDKIIINWYLVVKRNNDLFKIKYCKKIESLEILIDELIKYNVVKVSSFSPEYNQFGGEFLFDKYIIDYLHTTSNLVVNKQKNEVIEMAEDLINRSTNVYKTKEVLLDIRNIVTNNYSDTKKVNCYFCDKKHKKLNIKLIQNIDKQLLEDYKIIPFVITLMFNMVELTNKEQVSIISGLCRKNETI